MASRPSFKVGDRITFNGATSVYEVVYVDRFGEPVVIRSVTSFQKFEGPWSGIDFTLVKPAGISSKEDMEALYG